MRKWKWKWILYPGANGRIWQTAVSPLTPPIAVPVPPTDAAVASKYAAEFERWGIQMRVTRYVQHCLC